MQMYPETIDNRPVSVLGQEIRQRLAAGETAESLAAICRSRCQQEDCWWLGEIYTLVPQEPWRRERPFVERFCDWSQGVDPVFERLAAAWRGYWHRLLSGLPDMYGYRHAGQELAVRLDRDVLSVDEIPDSRGSLEWVLYRDGKVFTQGVSPAGWYLRTEERCYRVGPRTMESVTPPDFVLRAMEHAVSLMEDVTQQLIARNEILAGEDGCYLSTPEAREASRSLPAIMGRLSNVNIEV